MAIGNTRAGYGWAAIALHWISAAAVLALWWTGEQFEEAVGRPARLAAQASHVSLGMLLLTFLVARLLWNLSQPAPAKLETNRALVIAAQVVQGLLLAIIVVEIVTGPLAVWSAARPIDVYGWFAIPSPFPARVEWLHEACEVVHGWAANALWPVLAVHILGALKHVVIDRDATLMRMLWVRPRP